MDFSSFVRGSLAFTPRLRRRPLPEGEVVQTRRLSVAASCAVLALACASGFAAEPVTPPGQPEKGPGGAEYAHAKVRQGRHGKAALAYHLFEPAEPTPESAPVIVLNHGYAAVNPIAYGAWIHHLVRRGNIVIYPVYQAGLYTSSRKLTPNAIQAVKDALKELKDGEHVKPDESKFAIVGHSAGGIITANMAALAKREGLPSPRALMVLQPGVSRMFPLADLKQIPADALLLTLVGDKDGVTGSADAKLIYRRTQQIDKANKDYVVLRSDARGQTVLKAGHLAPIAVAADDATSGSAFRFRIREWFAGKNKGGVGGEDKDDVEPIMTDALDYYGTWKLFDGLCDAAFHGKNREYALGNTPQQRFMGKWSDGTAVKELAVTDEP